MLLHISDCLAATPAALGDPRKDSPEELVERHERVTAACLLALGALQEELAGSCPGPPPTSTATSAASTAAATAASTAAAAGGSSSTSEADVSAVDSMGEGLAAAQPADAAAEEVCAKIEQLLCSAGFFKRHLGAKSALVRRCAYSLVGGLARRAPQLLAGCLQPAAQAVLGAFQVRGGRSGGGHFVWQAKGAQATAH